MANQPSYPPPDYSYHQGGRPLQPPNTDPDEWRRIQTLNSILGHLQTIPVNPPYEHPNPFSPSNFPQYGWYPSQGPSPTPTSLPPSSPPFPFPFPTSLPPPPHPSIPTFKLTSTKLLLILPTSGEYNMYSRDPSLLPKSWDGIILDPTVTEQPRYKPCGEKSNLSWTSPRTGKTYQLPPMEDRYEGKHHYVCEYCGGRKMKFEGYSWCGDCRDNTKNVVVNGA